MLLVLCIGLQSVLLSAQRTIGRAHLHLGPALAGNAAEHAHEAHPVDDAIRGEHADDGVDDDDDDHDHHAGGHRHSHLGHHSHGGDRTDVVYVDEGGAEESASPSHGLKRGTFDFDGLWPAPIAFVTAESGRVHPAADAPSFRSHVAPPLKRPPRRGA